MLCSRACRWLGCWRRKQFFGRAAFSAIIDLPIVIPHSAAGLALLTVVGRHTPVGRLTGGGLVGTGAGIAVAMAFVSLPFLVNAAREAFLAVPPRLENAARHAGGQPSTCVLHDLAADGLAGSSPA